MDRTLFAFIWRHSKAQQIAILGVTLLSFPFLYASLELPKRIINDAIGAESATVALGPLTLGQVELLALLCAGFLAAVLAQGLFKMQINTMKGVVAERLLRRFRYQLISRILRFPQPYFRRTSQGELTAMVTSEAEPLGGIMGDMIAQPVFQGGMMLTIAGFLFVQNVWLGLAAVALVPLQAWLIPKLQRRINLLNKDRVKEVRRLAEEIGENAAGVGDLRTNGGWRLRLARVTDRLGRLFEIRYRIYRQKFFMKFLNNFITQLTPFFFFSIGGYLAIQGDLTVGALVAALAAYKDLSAPWKELLTWYNQVQDMGLRWHIITERFAPRGMVDEALFEGRPSELPRLAGPIRFENVSLQDADGSPVFEGLQVEIPEAATVAVATRSPTERRAFAELLAREVMPSAGRIAVAGHDLSSLHQGVIAARIGYAGPRPYLFNGTIGENLTMALRAEPRCLPDTLPEPSRAALAEARRAGNSDDPLEADWLDPARAEVRDGAALSDWWLRLTEAMGTDEFLFRRGLDARIDPDLRGDLARRIVELRPRIAERIAAAGLGKAVHRFAPDAFNPGLPVAGNLMLATPTRTITQEAMANDTRFLATLSELDLEGALFKLGLAVLSVTGRTFGPAGTDHPMFRTLGIDAELFERLVAIEAKAREAGPAALDRTERNLVLTVPFRFSADQIGEGFPETLKDKILSLRMTHAERLRERAGVDFEPIAEDRYARGLTLIENAIFGKICLTTGAKAQKLRDLIAEVLREEGLKSRVAELIYDVPTGIGGAELPQVAHERIAFVRAAIKRPDVLILDRALASHDRESRLQMRTRLRALLPETTLVFLEEDFRHRNSFDVYLEIEEGRIVSQNGVSAEPEAEDAAGADLSRKVRVLEKTELFSGLERRQVRLLAYGSRWVTAEPGEHLFHTGDPSDGAYLLVKGRAELRWPDAQPGQRPVSAVEPGRIVGDLSVLRGEARILDMIAVEPVKALRIGAEELRSVVEADIGVALSLLHTVSGYLVDVGGRLREAQRTGDPLDADPIR